MSIMQCEKHGYWDSDFKKGCPLCGLMGPQKWWLVERDGNPCLYISESNPLSWTYEPSEAKKFATKDAAQYAADYVRIVNSHASRVEEHIFNCRSEE